MKADLHLHSTISDGSNTIIEIIEKAKLIGLDAIAITDHDTLSHQKLIPCNPGLQVIAGIEISAVHKKTNTRTHILGYNINNPNFVTELTQPLLEARNHNSEKQITILQENGYIIDINKLAKAGGRYIYKQHIMDYLVSTGQATEMFGSFYRSIFKNNGICAFDIDYIDVFEAIRVLNEAGGLSVLAHPGQQQNFWLIPDLVKAGLDGIELNHHTNSPQDKKIIVEIASEYGLFLTGGSDYHGKYEPQPYGIGDFLSDESGVNKICRRL